MKVLVLRILFYIPICCFAQTQIGINIEGEAQGNRNGTSVSLSADGNFVAIGEPRFDGSAYNSGRVRIYENRYGTWTQVGDDIYGEDSSNYFGYSISLSSDGSIIAIGAYNNNNENGFNAGHVQVYVNNFENWEQIGENINGSNPSDWEGFSVSLSSDGTKLATGTQFNSEQGYNKGKVRVFENIQGTWTQLGNSIFGNNSGSLSGYCVSLSGDGNKVAIGAPYSSGNGNMTGQVRVFEYESGTWSQLGDDIYGAAQHDQSGHSVSLSNNGNILAIGSPRNSDLADTAGHVRIFQYNSGSWSQLGNTIQGENSYDQSGHSVSISANGNVVAIGAPNYDGIGTVSGYVRIYRYIGNTWQQFGNEIDGESAGDRNGTSISLSANGDFVATGSPYSSNNGSSSGQARVYEFTNLSSNQDFKINDFNIFPNPTSGYINIQLKKSDKIEKVNIYSSVGKLLSTHFNETISVHAFAKGIYFLEVITDKGNATKTFVVN